MTHLPESTSITLRALEGAPLADEATRRTVLAAAHALAERHGVDLVSIETNPDRLTVTLQLHRLGAIGFAAELRRLTEAWHKAHTGGKTLWGEPRVEPDEDDPADWWKR